MCIGTARNATAAHSSSAEPRNRVTVISRGTLLPRGAASSGISEGSPGNRRKYVECICLYTEIDRTSGRWLLENDLAADHTPRVVGRLAITRARARACGIDVTWKNNKGRIDARGFMAVSAIRDRDAKF